MKGLALFFALSILSFLQMFAQIEIIQPKLFPQTEIALFDKIEIRLSLPNFHNNYDPEVIKLDATLTSPTGRILVIPGFYFQEYEKVGDFDCGMDVKCENISKVESQPYNWIIRFSPDEVGTWKFKFTANGRSKTIKSLKFENGMFTCIDSDLNGFISKINNRYLGQNGRHLYFVGENIAWYESQFLEKPRPHFNETGANDHKRYIDSLAGFKANFMRVWINHIGGISLIDKDRATKKFHGFNNYNQKDAWQLDEIMTYANEKGINVILCLLPHSSFVNHYGLTFWKTWSAFNKNNPGNRGAGIDSPFEIFYNEKAIENTRNLFRYIIARWGYATNLIAWELWNEENQLLKIHGEEQLPIPLDEYADYVVSWHNSMADFFKKTDAFNHLVTTSSPNASCCSDREFPSIWFNMDLVISHDYKNFERFIYPFEFNQHLANQANEVFGITELNNKPYMCQEWGITPLKELYKLDPHGYALHCNLWSSSMSGAFGAIASWEWNNYIHRQNLYKRFKPVSVFMNSVVPELDGSNRGSWFIRKGLGVFYMRDDQANAIIGWCQDVNYDFSIIKDSRYIEDLKTNKPRIKTRRNKIRIRSGNNEVSYSVKWYNSQTANLVQEVKVISKRRKVLFNMPDVLRNSTFGDGVFLITKD